MADGHAMEYSLMNLHEDNEAFSELVAAAAESIGLPEVYVEKDYWVTRALKYLSESAHAGETVFKGGTSLSKAYRLIDRFSEDIDLAVFTEGKGDSARKKLLKNVEGIVTTNLEYVEDDERESKGSKYRKTVWRYPRSVDGTEFGQASPELLVEVNAFTHPEPYEQLELKTFIAEVLADQGRGDLIDQFCLQGFSINVLSVRRTLVEKMLSVIKDSYRDDPVVELSRNIRHLYDICLILRKEEHREFIESDEFSQLCVQCIEDEKAGYFEYSECLEKPLSVAPLFIEFEGWVQSLEPTYKGAFSELVYGERPEMNDIATSLELLKDRLFELEQGR